MLREMFGQFYPVVVSLGFAFFGFIALMLFIFKVLLRDNK